MIKLLKNIFKGRGEPKFAKCLNNRTWLDRQVDDALYKRNTISGNSGGNLFTDKTASHIIKPSDNWYDKYYDNEK